ncbi:hypothetical protein B7463_g10849, partial [Scytalidium lignicola]
MRISIQFQVHPKLPQIAVLVLTLSLAYITNALTFMTTGTAPPLPAKPYLFCDSTWLHGADWLDEAFDANGDPLVVERGGKEVELAIAQEYLLLNGQGDFAFNNKFVRAFIKQSQASIPAWAPKFDSKSGNLGLTVTGETPSWMILCPVSFSSQYTPGLGVNPTPNSAITTVVPRSSTLLHELIHLTNPQGQTEDYSYDLVEIVETSQAEDHNNLVLNSQNPETYMYFLIAVWYHTKAGSWNSGSGQSDVNFATALAKYQ